MHKLLRRQLTKHGEGLDQERFASLLQAISAAYDQAEEDRLLLERSLELTSDELNENNAELARSNQELQEFAYVTSHDLQEPLRSVIGYTQLLERRYGAKLGEDADHFIKGAVGGARRMQQLIRDLLSYARVGSHGGAFVTIELDAIVDEVLEDLDMALQDAGAVLTRAPLPQVRGDAVQLRQVVQNLVANAVRFRSTRPLQIDISAEHAGARWIISVEDNGIGIPTAHAERVFGVFQRLHERDKFPGTGIGLAICAKVLERHGGRIWVEQAESGGCRFRFTLDRAEAPSGRGDGEMLVGDEEGAH